MAKLFSECNLKFLKYSITIRYESNNISIQDIKLLTDSDYLKFIYCFLINSSNIYEYIKQEVEQSITENYSAIDSCSLILNFEIDISSSYVEIINQKMVLFETRSQINKMKNSLLRERYFKNMEDIRVDVENIKLGIDVDFRMFIQRLYKVIDFFNEDSLFLRQQYGDALKNIKMIRDMNCHLFVSDYLQNLVTAVYTKNNYFDYLFGELMNGINNILKNAGLDEIGQAGFNSLKPKIYESLINGIQTTNKLGVILKIEEILVKNGESIIDGDELQNLNEIKSMKLHASKKDNINKLISIANGTE